MKITLPIVKVPEDVQVTLFLICEELKSRKLFHALNEIGLGDCYFLPHLDSLIMKNIGLDDESDETVEAYHKTLDEYSKLIYDDRDFIIKQALQVYDELRNISRSQKESI